MATSNNDRASGDQPRTSAEWARPDTEPHANIVHHRDPGPHAGHAAEGPAASAERRAEPRAEASAERSAKASNRKGDAAESDPDPGLAAGGSRQETALHGRPATGGGSNEFARKPDTSHHDLRGAPRKP